jgi:hypothetical protein
VSIARRLGRDRAALAVAAGFAASRAAFHLAGASFDAGGLGLLWQLLDPTWLRDDLLRSLVTLHAQPPLMNAVIGAVLKLGVAPVAVFHALYEATGLLLALALLGVLRRLGFSDRVAAALALVWTWSPTALLYEHWLMYTHFEAAAAVGAAWSLHRLAQRGRARDAALYFALLAGLALTRSLYHLIWLVPCAALGLAAARPLRPAVVASCALALAAVLGVYAKNAWLFGVPSTSSWFGMNLANGVFELWPLDERVQLADAGAVSPLVQVPPFSTLDQYAEWFDASAPQAPPALREPLKATGIPNFNHVAYVAISRQYGRDAAALIERDPGRYAAMVGRAWQRFWTQPSRYPFVERNRRRIAGWDRLYAALQGVPRAFRPGPDGAPLETSRTPPGWIAWLWLAACAAAIAWTGRAVWRARGAWAREASADARARAALLAFQLFQVLFVPLASNAVELGENHRFRVAIEPLLLALVATCLRDLRARR